MSFLLKLSAFIAFVSFHHVQSRNSKMLESNILNSIFKGYDPTVRPSRKNLTGPVIVKVNTYIRRLRNVDEAKMVYDVQLTFRQSWMDERLKFDQKGIPYVTIQRPENLWTPDVFFVNEATGHFHTMLTPNNLIRIYSDGIIAYSTRVSLRLFCPMDLRNYPMDKQTCKIICASYGYTEDNLIILWSKDDPVVISKNAFLNVPKFSLDLLKADYCTSRTHTGKYSCVQVKIELSRNFFHYFKRAYIPTIVPVLLSWIVFWLNPRYANSRVGIWICTLITIVFVTTVLNSNHPEVYYIKALDVWMCTCVCFVFCVSLELCLVNNALTKEEDSDEKTFKLQKYEAPFLRWLNKYTTKTQRIDAVFRILFPTAFVFFNIVYWITYAVNR